MTPGLPRATVGPAWEDEDEPDRLGRTRGGHHRRWPRHRPRHRPACDGVRCGRRAVGPWTPPRWQPPAPPCPAPPRIRLDLTDEAAVRAAAAATEAAHGRIDILVNNAGITGGNAPTWQLPAAEWRRVLEVNLVAPYLVCAAVLPGMIARGYGRVVNVASVAGKEGNPNASHYSASKAGLIGLTKSLGKELAQTGVLVNCITPAAAKDRPVRPDERAADRLHAGQDPHGPLRDRRGRSPPLPPGS